MKYHITMGRGSEKSIGLKIQSRTLFTRWPHGECTGDDEGWKWFDDDYDRYLHNGCGALAWEINQRTKWPLYALYSTEEKTEDFPIPEHVIIRHPSGDALDITGLFTFPLDAEPLTPKHLEALFDGECIGIPEAHPAADEVAKRLLDQIT